MSDIPPELSPPSTVPPVLNPAPMCAIGGAGKTWTEQQGRDLKAGLATVILLTYIAGQVIGGMLVGIPIGFVAGVSRAMRHARTPMLQEIEALKPTMTLWGGLLGVIVGGVAMLYLSKIQLGERLYDRQPTGAAWVYGRPRQNVVGLGLGLVVGLFSTLIVAAFRLWGLEPTFGPTTKMLLTPGLPQVIMVAIALLLAPPIEEMLFRGVLLGGYQRSFGQPAAVALTVSIFVLMHLPEMIGFVPAAFGIAALASVATWMRLRAAAIGPAVAVHFGYNLVLTTGVICATWHK